MNNYVLPYLIPYFVSAFISASVAYYAWQRRHVSGTKPFVLMASSQVLWTVGYVFELISPSLQGKLFWDDVQFVAATLWPAAFFAFAWQFSGRRWQRPRLAWSLINAPFFLFFLLLLTNRWHALVRSNAWLISGMPFDILYYDFSFLVYVFSVYMYGVFASGIYVLIKTFFHAHKLYRRQVLFVLIGMIIPVAGTLLTLVGISFAAQRDTTPLTFAVSNLIIAWALYRYGLFDIVPIARDKVVENMSDLVFVLDGQNRFVDMNRAAEQVLGRGSGDVIGQPAMDILTEWAHLIPLFGGESETVVEVEAVFEGEVYYLAVKMTPLHDEWGQLNGRLVMARDVTDMKRVEQKLQEHAAQLETANAELLALSAIKDEFVTNVSHELRTPLANLKLYHDLMLRKPARLSNYAVILQRETERLELIIEDLLALSRLDSDREPIQCEDTNLNDLVEILALDRQQLAAQRGLNLQYELDRELPLVFADFSMMSQVLGILLTNAMNYTPSGGEIVIYTRGKQVQAQAWAGFYVQDTGYGISAIDQAQLFTRFFRGEASSKIGNAGTGLGLAIAKEIVDRHRGQIEIYSNGLPGEGTAVYVWLPVSEKVNEVTQ